MATKSLSISVTTSSIIAKIRRNLAIIGKRARRNSGESMFNDITTSTAEDPIFDDLLMFGAENIVSCLSDVASGYAESKNSTSDSQSNKIEFTLFSERWCTSGTYDMDLTSALSNLISNYLYNFCIGRYLSEIHPSTGDKYPPLYGQTYNDHCTLLINNIKTLAFTKRPVGAAKNGTDEITYGSVAMEKVENQFGDDITPEEYDPQGSTE